MVFQRLRRILMASVATWLRNKCNQLYVKTGDKTDMRLFQSLDAWLIRQIEKSDQLVIGFVRCRECGCQWEALAYSTTLHILECPNCFKQYSEVVGTERVYP